MTRKQLCIRDFRQLRDFLVCVHFGVCQGRLNQWAHWARAQGPRIFFLFEGPPTGCGEINIVDATAWSYKH